MKRTGQPVADVGDRGCWGAGAAGQPVWMHGDPHPANLLVERGELSAVIDFGLLGVGDPACDLVVAWTYLSADSRDVFRSARPLMMQHGLGDAAGHCSSG